ncbi:MAG: hypothetical protein LUH07_15790, partial [Lachnospiraceae bacterium]|nr:hypothetical protein [Lachnospiraceae bacterium]
MRKKTVLLILLLFSYLLLCPQTALHSARDGLLLWYHSVLPVIFPFMFLSTLTLRILDADSLPEAFSRPLTRLFGCTAYGAFVILAGYLCGFPMGAKLTGDLYREKKITREEAHFLYGFANNLSPGFILTYLASEQMLLPNQAGYFLLQILGASLLKGWIEARKRKPFQPLPAAPQNKPAEKLTFSMVDDCINDAVSNVLR